MVNEKTTLRNINNLIELKQNQKGLLELAKQMDEDKERQQERMFNP